MMHLCAGVEQRLGSSKRIQGDCIAASGQLPFKRQQAASSRVCCAARNTLPPSSASQHNGAEQHGRQQQLQDHLLYQQSFHQEVQPATPPAGQFRQQSSADTVAPMAFYDPAGVHSNNASASPQGPFGPVLAPPGILSPNAGQDQLTSSSSLASINTSIAAMGKHDSSSGHSSSGSNFTLQEQPQQDTLQEQPQQELPQPRQPPQHRRDQEHKAAPAAANARAKPKAGNKHGSSTSSRSSNKKQQRHKGVGERAKAAVDDLTASKQLTCAIAQASCWQELYKLLQQHSARMNHIHAAALLNTTSKLVQYHQLDPQQQQLFTGFYTDALQLAYSQAQGSARPRELSSMLWAVAKVGLHPGDDWLAAYLAAVQAQLQAMNAQDVGLLVWALARFRLQPEPSFCAELLSATQHQFAVACSSSGTNSSSSSSGSSSGRSRTSSSSSNRQRGFDSQGLCNVLWGLAVLEVHPGQEWLAAAAAAAERPLRTGQFEPQGVAVMLWALAKFGFRPQQAWLHVAADAAAWQLHAFKPAEVSMLCHALARLHYQPPQQQQQQPQEQGSHADWQAQGEQAQHQNAAGAADSAMQQKQQPAAVQQQDPHLQDQQQQQSLMAHIQAVSWPQLQCLRFSEAANLLWGLGVMGQQPSAEWVDSALQQLQATLHEADAKALACACYGLAKLQHKGADEWWKAVWQHVPRVLGLPAVAGTGAVTCDISSNGVRSSSSSNDGNGYVAAGWGSSYAASQSQATLLWAAAALKAQPPTAVADGLFAASEQHLQQQAVNGAELLAISTAAVKLQLAPPSSWLQAVEGMFGVLLQYSLRASPQQESALQQGQGVELLEQQAQQPQQQQRQLVLHCLSALQQQQPQQQQQDAPGERCPQLQQPAVGLPHPRLRPKEVSNIVFSLARLRYTPSAATLAVLQQYVQQKGQQFVDTDWQQLTRALQSMFGQLQQAQKVSAAAHAAVVAGNTSSTGCACSNGSSVQGVGLHHMTVAGADAVPCGGHAVLESLAGSVGSLGFQSSQQLVHGQEQQLMGLVDGAHGAAFAADGDLQGEELLVYGKYLQLPINGHSGSRDSMSSSSVCVSGFAGTGAAADADRRPVSGAVPYRRRNVHVRPPIAVAGGLSVAAS